MVLNNRLGKMKSEKLLDLDFGPKTIDHLCECSFHGDMEIEVSYGGVQERMESIDSTLEEFSSGRMEEGGMVG